MHNRDIITDLASDFNGQSHNQPLSFVEFEM